MPHDRKEKMKGVPGKGNECKDREVETRILSLTKASHKRE